MQPPYRPRQHARGKLISSFGFALAGLRQVLKGERNARIHVAIAALVIACGFWLRLSPLEWAVVGLTIALVLAGEVFNTALELIVDMTRPHTDPLAKRAKDMAAGATLVAACGAAIVGLLILGPKLWARVVPWLGL